MDARLDESERVAETLPHRERYLKLSQSLARRIVEAHREWLDEAERELDSGRPVGSSSHAPKRATSR